MTLPQQQPTDATWLHPAVPPEPDTCPRSSGHHSYPKSGETTQSVQVIFAGVLSTDEASNNAGRRVGGGECGGKAAGRRKGKGQRMLRTQSRNRHVPDGLSPRIGTGWAAQAPNADRV